jgi:hypothetical protein
MKRTILWLEDNPMHHLDLDLALDVAEDQVPRDVMPRYVSREGAARAVLAEGGVALFISDASLEFGPEPPENGVMVVRNLRRDGVLRGDVPVVFRTGYPRAAHQVDEREFPHWFTRDDDRFGAAVLQLLTTGHTS